MFCYEKKIFLESAALRLKANLNGSNISSNMQNLQFADIIQRFIKDKKKDHVG